MPECTVFRELNYKIECSPMHNRMIKTGATNLSASINMISFVLLFILLFTVLIYSFYTHPAFLAKRETKPSAISQFIALSTRSLQSGFSH